MEARAAALEEQLKAEQLKPSKLVTADTFWPVERTTNRPSLDTAPCVSLSSQWGYATMPQLTADRSTTMLDIAGFMSSSVACVTTLSMDTVTVSSGKYPSLISAPLVSQQQLGNAGEIHQQFSVPTTNIQSSTTITCQPDSQILTSSSTADIYGLGQSQTFNSMAGQSVTSISAAGTQPNSTAGNVITPVCTTTVSSTPASTIGSLSVPSVPTQPVIVVNTPQIVHPHNGFTSWTSFWDHFKRVATVNRWEDNTTKAQHLMLALEGTAAEVLKEINDTSPTVYQDIWKALSRRFGEVDEVRESMRKFENRKQQDSETVV